MYSDPRLAYLSDILKITRSRFGTFVKRMAAGSFQGSRSIPVTFEPRWNFGYDEDFSRGARLYDVAKRRGWDPRRDIDYSKRLPRSELAIKEDMFLGTALGLSDYVSQESLIRLSHAVVDWQMSQILHGEQGALMLCSQLVNVCRENDGKLFLASQAMDEARHMEVFTRYITQQGTIYDIDFGVKFVIDAFLSSDNWRKQAIGMLVLVEGYALGTFAITREMTNDPVLDQMLEFVMRDEGRHVGFGLAAIRDSLDELTDQERIEMEDYAFSLVRSVAITRNSAGGFRDMITMYWKFLGPEIHKYISHQELEDLIVDHPFMHEFNEIVFENNLLPNLNRLGLLSQRMIPRYATIGLSIRRFLEKPQAMSTA